MGINVLERNIKISSRIKPRSRFLVPTLIMLAFIGAYTQINLYSPLYVPFILFIFSGLILFFLYPLYQRETFIIIALAMFLIGNLALSTMLRQDFSELSNQFQSAILFLLTLVSALGLTKCLRKARNNEFRKYLKVALAVILVGTFLELLGILKPFSDNFRELVYSAELIYTNDIRDIALSGKVRPKLFTSEPSHLGKVVCVLLCCLTLISKKNSEIFIYVSLGFLGLATIGSPVIIVSILLGTYISALNYGINKLLSNPFIVIIITLILFFIFKYIFQQVDQRIIDKMDPSVYMRIIRPFLVVSHVFNDSLWMGYGIGARESLVEYFLIESQASYSPKFIRQMGKDTSEELGNVYAAMLIQFGVIGSIIWLLIIQKYAKYIIGRSTLHFWVFFLLYSFFTGSLHTPIFIVPLTLIATCLRIRGQLNSSRSNN